MLADDAADPGRTARTSAAAAPNARTAVPAANPTAVPAPPDWTGVDPRHQILRTFDAVVKGEGDPDRSGDSVDDEAAIFSVWRPTSDEAIENMMHGIAVGKGLDIQGRSAKRGNISSFVPFLQIHQESHKEIARAYIKEEKSIRVFYQSKMAREEAFEIVSSTKIDMLGRRDRAMQTLSNNNADPEDKKLARQHLMYDYDEANLFVDFDDAYATSSRPVFGLDISEHLFWESYVMTQDCFRPRETEWDIGRPSSPPFMDMNFKAIRQDPEPGTPRVVVFQMSKNKPMEPRMLLMAYEEHGGVKPVVSDFDCFLLGTRGVKYEDPIPKDHIELLQWSVGNTSKVLDERESSSNEGWTGTWLKVITKAAMMGFYPKRNGDYGVPKSCSWFKAAVSHLKETGCVRHGEECFNSWFPQELDDQWLVISNTLPGNEKWKKVNVQELQELLIAKIDEGFTFPINPKWVLCDPGWRMIYDRLLASKLPNVQDHIDCWLPPETGLREKIEEISSKHPSGFERSLGYEQHVNFVIAGEEPDGHVHAGMYGVLLGLCKAACRPKGEADDMKRSNSWQPVRNWFKHNEGHGSSDWLKECLRCRDSKGHTPLHIACLMNAPLDIVSQMLKNDTDSATRRVSDENEGYRDDLPLHTACRLCSSKVIFRLYAAYPQGARKENYDGRYPFELLQQSSSDELIKLVLESSAGTITDKAATAPTDEVKTNAAASSTEMITVYDLLDLCKDCMSPDIFQHSVVKHCEFNTCVTWLNKLSCDRWVVFFMMLELNLHLALTVSFIQASKFHFKPDNSLWPILMIPPTAMFLLIEVHQFSRYLKMRRPSSYLIDVWNWLDLTAIGLSIASATKFLTEEPILTSNADTTSTRRLLMATGFFICLFFISYLKKTFFSFSRFVGAVVNIIWVLIPFVVVSFLFISAFAYMYFVQQQHSTEGEEYESLEEATLAVYSLFIGGLEETDSSLDSLFGFLIIIVLLNVIIAVVGEAWAEVKERSDEYYWYYRLQFIIEVTRIHRNDWQICGRIPYPGLNRSCCTIGVRHMYELLDDWTLLNLKRYIGLRYQGRPAEEQKYIFRNPTRVRRCIGESGSESGSLSDITPDGFGKVGVTIFVLFCASVLGFLTTGLLWPMFVIELLFTSDKAKSVSNKPKEKHLKAMEELKTENQKQAERMELLISQVEDEILVNREKGKKQSEQIEKQTEQIDKLVTQIEQVSRIINLLVEQTNSDTPGADSTGSRSTSTANV